MADPRSPTSLPFLLAHESGFAWDEVLVVVAGVVAIGGILVWVERRVRRDTRDGGGRLEDDD